MKKFSMNSLGFMREIEKNNQPKALELANWLETGEIEEIDLQESAEELRKQHAEIEALRKQLELTSHNLKMGVSKSIQKVIANAIDEVLRGE